MSTKPDDSESGDALPNHLLQMVQQAANMNPNLPMMQLSPNQIHDRLTARWSTQMVQVTLMAGIHLSLMFGSEFASLDFDQFFVDESATRWVKTVYVWCSVFAFIGNLLKANCFAQLISDIGRVPDHRMKALLSQQPGVTHIDQGPLMWFELSSMLQMWMAIGALEPRAIPALPLAYAWGLRLTVFPRHGAAAKARLPNHYDLTDPETGEVLHRGVWDAEGSGSRVGNDQEEE
eukprot:COSAG02_NODE_1166_length_14154_cov_19.442191_10_plen_233_part_00